MAFAAFLPAPMAKITVAAPVTASPPAYTPSLLVAPVSSSTIIPPHFWVLSPGVVDVIRGLGLWPIAIITVSTSITNSESCFTTASFCPNCQARQVPFQYIPYL
jgi:hypothetical protein